MRAGLPVRAGQPARGAVAARGAAAAVLTAVGVAIAAGGCGSVGSGSANPAARPVSLPLATSLAAGQTTWAVIPMGAASGSNLFWQLFELPAGGPSWRLATPPDVATNGAIALGVQGGPSLVAGIHPSLLLDFSPVTSTPDGGRTWSTGAPDPGLASVPDALGAAPSGGQLIALDRNGSAQRARGGGTASVPWTMLTSMRALAATPAGRACELTGLTAAAFGPSGAPVLAGNCGRPGVTGIFADQGGTWQAAGPPLPAPLNRRTAQVLRLIRIGSSLTAVLQVGAGRTASLLTAWTTGTRWTLSAPLPLAGRSVASSSFGNGGSTVLTLSGGHADYLAGPGASWRSLPKLPLGRTVTLALPAGGGVDALAADGSVLTVWRLRSGQQATGGSGASGSGAGTRAGGGTWVKGQQTKVPIQYGSSG